GLNGVEPHLTSAGLIRMKLPIAETAFRPRLAYKAIAKMGLALLPDEELDNYQRLRAWVLAAAERSLFRSLNVTLSFASISNSPHLVCSTLLRRIDPRAAIPHIVFVFCAGSVCIQIGLMPDRFDGHLSQSTVINIKWRSIVKGPDGQSLLFDYGHPVHRDWSSHDPETQPVEYFWLEFNPRTCEGSITPVFR